MKKQNCSKCGKGISINNMGNEIGKLHDCLPFVVYDNTELSKKTGIEVDLLDLWNNIEVWYGDISKGENQEEFLKRIQHQYLVKKKIYITIQS